MLIIVGLSWIMVKFTARPQHNPLQQSTYQWGIPLWLQAKPFSPANKEKKYWVLPSCLWIFSSRQLAQQQRQPFTNNSGHKTSNPLLASRIPEFWRPFVQINFMQDSAPQIFILSAQFFSLLCTLFPCMYYAFQWKLWGEWVDYLKILWSGLELARNPRSSAKIVSSSVTKPFSGDFIALPLRACPKR